MERNIQLRENLTEFEKYIRILAGFASYWDYLLVKSKDDTSWEDTIENNGITYKIKYETTTKYNQDKSNDTKNTITITSGDNRQIQFEMLYHKADWLNNFDFQYLKTSIIYKSLIYNTSMKMMPQYSSREYKDMFNYTMPTEERDLDVYIDCDYYTLDLFPYSYDIIQKKDGIIITEEMFENENTSKRYSFKVSNDCKTILEVENTPIPSLEELQKFNIFEERKNYLSKITGPLTPEKLNEINKTYQNIGTTGIIYEQIVELYPKILKSAKKAIDTQNEYREVFAKAYFTNDELAFIRNYIVEKYIDILDDVDLERQNTK